MRFINDTCFDAELFRSEMPNGRMMASLLVRITYPIVEDGSLGSPNMTELARIRRDCISTPDCDFDPEIVFPRTATDLLILGDATVDEPTDHMQMTIGVGPYEHVLTISGDRIWERGFAGLRPSPPLLFTEMALSWAHAYGGAAPAEYGPMPYPANPRGRGYYLRESDARDHHLPNIEWAGEEVVRWDDRPEPAIVGPYPSSWWSRLSRTWKIDVDDRRVEPCPDAGLFDQAHPRLSGGVIQAGDPLRILGLGPPILGILPACPVRATFLLGGRHYPRELTLEEVLVDARRRQIELAWRKIVQYEYVRHEVRTALLTDVQL